MMSKRGLFLYCLLFGALFSLHAAQPVGPMVIYSHVPNQTSASTPSASPSHNSPSTSLQTPAAHSTEKVMPATPSKPVAREGIELSWYGHSFVYLISRNGIRIALDPFGEAIPKPFPENLQADVVLISYEGEDRNGGERFTGSPQVFRGVLGAGINRARGVLFKGVESWRDNSHGIKLGKNIIYTFDIDGIRFCHLGGLGEKLSTSQYEEIGHADVLFLPVGNPRLTVDQLWQIVHQLNAKWVIPIAYRDEKMGMGDLCSLDAFIEKYPARRFIEEDSFILRRTELPPKPTLLLLKQK